MAVVLQDAYLFDGTVRDNLRLAAPDATEEELWEALDAAALAETIATFPAGLDTVVGPGGEKLSGGQRRRLSVAPRHGPQQPSGSPYAPSPRASPDRLERPGAALLQDCVVAQPDVA